MDATNAAKLHGTKLHNKKWALDHEDCKYTDGSLHS